MAHRKQFVDRISEVMKKGGHAMASGRFVHAFNNYEIAVKALRDSESKLFCRANMLYCQYIEKAISPQIIIERARALLPELQAVILANTKNKERFELCLQDIQSIVERLATSDLIAAYTRGWITLAITRSNDDKFSRFVSMMEIDTAQQTYEVDYLNTLYAEMVATGVKSVLRAQLAEAIAGAYVDCAEEADDVADKKRFLLFAKAAYQRAKVDWYSVSSRIDAINLLPSILFVLRSRYELAVAEESDADRVQLYRAFEEVLQSEEVRMINAKMKGMQSTVQLRVEIHGHKIWFERIGKEIAQEKRPSLDKMLMPPPVATKSLKARRIGLGIFVESKSVMQQEAQIHTPQAILQ